VAISQLTTEGICVGDIITDGGTQARAMLDQATVDAYVADMEAGAVFPPIVVFYDGDKYWLADGFHRYAAIIKRKACATTCEVKAGTRRDAMLYAAGANATNGLRRTNEDKRRAVQMLLGDDEWVKKSDRWIAEKCGVSPSSVGKLRPALSKLDNAPPETRTTTDGREYPVQRKQPSKPSTKKDAKPVPDENTQAPEPEQEPDTDAERESDPRPKTIEPGHKHYIVPDPCEVDEPEPDEDDGITTDDPPPFIPSADAVEAWRLIESLSGQDLAWIVAKVRGI